MCEKRTMNVRQLKDRLKGIGRTHTDLATYLGITHGQVSRILNGKNRLRVDMWQRIEAFLAEAERKARPRGVAESAPAPFEHRPPQWRSITLEEARALKANPPPKLPQEERDRIIQELIQLGDAYRAMAGANTRSEDDILGYGEDGLPEQ